METERKNPDTDRTNRRKGAAFDTKGHVFRDVREFLFQNGFIMRNRPGATLGTDNDPLSTGFIKVFNIFESYFQKIPSLADGINAFFLGRTGQGEMRNTSLVEIAVDHRTEIGDSQGYVNGIFRARASRDGENGDIRDGLYIFDRGTESASREGTVDWLVAAGEGGQVRLTYMPDRDGNPLTDALFDIYISAQGISMFGLPTGNPGGTGKVWNDGGTLKIT